MSRHFTRLAEGIAVGPLLDELAHNSELWGQERGRTGLRLSPHRESLDIWVRYRETPPADIHEAFASTWWPAWRVLPALRPLVFSLMRRVEATHLGGILLTKLPPGGRIHPHHDRGSWHAEFHNCKLYVCLAGNGGCINRFGEGLEEEFVMRPGEAWAFDNQTVHECLNLGATERLSAIISMRVEP